MPTDSVRNTQSSRRPKIAVVGSMNVDVFICVERNPILGETIAAKKVVKAFGGKVSQHLIEATDSFLF